MLVSLAVFSPSSQINLVRLRGQVAGGGGGVGVPPGGGGHAGFPLEHPAQIGGAGKAAQPCDHLQAVLPLQQQQLGGLDAGAGQVLARADPHLRRKAPHQVAFAHTQLAAQLLHAVQPDVIAADGLHRGGHQRAQLPGRGVGAGQLAQQRVDRPALLRCRGGAVLAQQGQQLGGARAGGARHKPGIPQPFTEQIGGLAGQLHRQQMAGRLGDQLHRPAAQQQIPRRAVGGLTARGLGTAVTAGQNARPQPCAGQGQRCVKGFVPHLGKRADGGAVKNQLLTLHINKILYLF